MKKLLSLCLFILAITSCKNEPEQDPVTEEKELTVIEKIAKAHGLENFDEVEELKYTFNVKVNDSLRSSRAWTWQPKEHLATLTTPDSTVTYNYKTEAEAHKNTDQRFINDKYWFLFPFQMSWDKMDYEHKEEAKAPISGEMMQQVTVKYPSDAGYTPGDVYEVYFGDDYIIREWVYFSGGSRERPLATTWENYKDFNGMKIAQNHKTQDGSFELFFTDVGVVTE